MVHKNNRNLTVVNFFPGPGVGKSTLALGLSYMMKRNQFNVEYVPEIAKDFIYDKRHEMFAEQDFMLAGQHNRLRRLLNSGIEYAVVDGPLYLSHFYSGENFPVYFHQLVDNLFNSFTNINFVVHRKHPYVGTHRNETEEQADEVNRQVRQRLVDDVIPVVNIPSTIELDELYQLFLREVTK